MNRDWLQTGSEPSIAELLNDPTTQAIMRYDGLGTEEIWKVVGDARRKLAMRSPARERRARGRQSGNEQRNPRSLDDDLAILAVVDIAFAGSLGEWPDIVGAGMFQGRDPLAPGVASGPGPGAASPKLQKPCERTRPARNVGFRDKPIALFAPPGHSMLSSDCPTEPFCGSR